MAADVTAIPSWAWLSLLILLSTDSCAQQQGNPPHEVCGGCKGLQKQVDGLDRADIVNRADREQGGGDFLAAAKTMCGGVCSGVLLHDAGGFSNLGVLLKEIGLLSAAKACYRLASRLEPWNSGHKYRTGNAMLATNDLGRAREAYVAATKLNPHFGDAYNNLGNCLAAMSLFRLAGKSYQHAVNANPRNANYYCNLGGMVAREDLREGVRLLEQGLRLNPLFPEVYNNLANFQRDLGQLREAMESYEQALKLLPDSGEVLVNLITARSYLCEWKGRDKMLSRLTSKSEHELAAGLPVSLTPFYASTLGLPPPLLLRLAQYQATAAVARTSYLVPTLPPDWQYTFPPLPLPGQEGRGAVRVGLISSDLTNHVVGHGVAALLKALEHSSVQVWCFALTADDGSAAREAIKQRSTLHEVAALSDPEIAGLVNAQRLHVLWDLNGHTKGNRQEVLAFRPARIQGLFHGYAGSSGAPFIHFFLADRIVATPEMADYWSEKLLLMPEPFSFFLFEDYGDTVPVTRQVGYTRPDVGSAEWLEPDEGRQLETSFRYVCFNNMYKVTPETLAVWASVLKRVGESVLWLLKMPAEAEPALRRAASRKGLASHRLVFSPLFPREEHVRWKSLGGLFLDSLLYNAHSTAADALAAGVPLVTRAGPAMPARVSASLLLAAGLGECVARTVQEYVALGVRGGRAGGGVAQAWRRKLEAQLQTRPLFDRQGWTAEFERLIRSALDVAMSESRDNVAPMHVIGHSRRYQPGKTVRARQAHGADLDANKDG